MQETYPTLLLRGASQTAAREDFTDSFVPKVRPKRRQNARLLRRRLTALASCLCVTLALSSLLLTGLDAADRMLLQGGAMEYIITGVFGMGSEYEASNFTELLMEQSFWGNARRTKTDTPPFKAYPLPGLSRLLLPVLEGEKPVSAEPQPEPEPEAPKFTLETLYQYDPALVPSGHLPIIPKDLTREYDGVLKLYNETKYTPNLAAIAESGKTIPAFVPVSASDAPLVLIIHTHGTEAYSEEGSVSYSDSYNIPRSSDTTKNVVAVGSAMAKVFREAGIPTLHCEIMHDQQSYKDSYNRAAQTIKQYLAEYPSIKYIFDVHRDSILQADQSKVRPVTLVNEHPTAQVMFVVGTDYYGANHPNWMQNLTFAVRVQTALNASHPGFARSICLRGAAFNEQYTPGSLLLEVGSCGNTLTEALRAGETLAKTLATIIKSGW